MTGLFPLSDRPRTRLAIAQGEDSIQGSRLDKYLRLAHSSSPPGIDRPPLPADVETLLALQTEEGRWESLAAVQGVVGELSLGQSLEEWRQATALALAFLRQRTELFDQLLPVYRSGERWVSPELMQIAVRSMVLQESSPWLEGDLLAAPGPPLDRGPRPGGAAARTHSTPQPLRRSTPGHGEASPPPRSLSIERRPSLDATKASCLSIFARLNSHNIAASYLFALRPG